MLTEFKYIGVSFKKADLELREALSLNENECKQLVSEIIDITDCHELLIISTCNRTGVYYNHPSDLSNDIIKLLGIKKGIQNLSNQKDNFLHINDHSEAVDYIYRVSMGLESQVVGDLQISNQFKKAYQTSADLNACGPFVHRLMHSIFFANKRVVQETSFRDGAASVSYAAVELAEDFADAFKDGSLLVLGLGEIGKDVASNLKRSDIPNITLCNRTEEVAKSLAEEFDFNYCPLENLEEAVANHNIIISSVQADSPIITPDTLTKAGDFGLKYFIDLSVPRSIAPTVGEIPGTLIYNIDNIKNLTEEIVKKRLEAIPQVEAIISSAITDLETWEQEMEVSPTIHKLKNALEGIRKEEISKYTKNINPEEMENIELITKGMMQKIIKLPVLQLKAACKRGEAETLIDILNDLFNLEKQEETID